MIEGDHKVIQGYPKMIQGDLKVVQEGAKIAQESAKMTQDDAKIANGSTKTAYPMPAKLPRRGFVLRAQSCELWRDTPGDLFQSVCLPHRSYTLDRGVMLV